MMGESELEKLTRQVAELEKEYNRAMNALHTARGRVANLTDEIESIVDSHDKARAVLNAHGGRILGLPRAA